MSTQTEFAGPDIDPWDLPRFDCQESPTAYGPPVDPEDAYREPGFCEDHICNFRR